MNNQTAEFSVHKEKAHYGARDRDGGWMQTFSGKQFWPMDPHVDDIDIRDIAHSLSMQCRYNGHSLRYYSVAEHSVYVSRYVSGHLALEGLLHDAAEAYLCDIPRPLKPHLTNYRETEERLERVIATHFGLKYPFHPDIKRVDSAILGDEKEALMSTEPEPWYLPYEALGVKIEGWMPQEAEKRFLERYRALRGAVQEVA